MERERARGTESERGWYEIDDEMLFCLAPSFGRLTLRPRRARPSRRQSVPSRSPFQSERSEKRTLRIRALLAIRAQRRAGPDQRGFGLFSGAQ